MNRVEYGGYIKNGKLIYDESKDKIAIKFDKLKKDGDGKEFIWSVEIVNKVKHYQHKYYRGYLLPAVADAMGERDLGYVHYLILKKQFLFNQYESWEKIPSKYRSRAFIYYTESNGRIDIYGWAPSCGDLTLEEMKTFILQVEQYLLIDCEGCIMENEARENAGL